MPNPEFTANPPIPSKNPDLALTDQPLSTLPNLNNPTHGASVEFLGIVRNLENNRPISGIDYQAYAPMVHTKLLQLASEGAAKFGPHTLKLHHRIGFVPIAQPSVIIRVTTPHSQAAFDICREYLHRLKTEIPIWKHIVFAED